MHAASEDAVISSICVCAHLGTQYTVSSSICASGNSEDRKFQHFCASGNSCNLLNFVHPGTQKCSSEGAPIKSKPKPTDLRRTSNSSKHHGGPALSHQNALHPSKLNSGCNFPSNGHEMKVQCLAALCHFAVKLFHNMNKVRAIFSGQMVRP